MIGDRQGELIEWIDAWRVALESKVRIFAFANNHYVGHHPATVWLFLQLVEKNKI